ncbi:hypothetical protein ACFOLK_07570 [Marinococcus halophilus]|uniref:Lipoprotein n=1 Tax=Marinococcus halophilus TaxID=1371 RepID=A0A510Y3U9_MARHA|nr:hypothetical protein [Marinococcus halophilus]GEK57974.1 hypothetical protein MHA01_08790 [Marinococcus halophilus]
MKQWLKIIMVTLLMIAPLSSLSACGDDEESDGMPEEIPNNEDE